MALLDNLKELEPDKKESPFLHALYDGLFTFLYTPNHVTKGSGTHIRDNIDLKRTMIFVVMALQLCYIFGTYNIGHQHFAALGLYPSFVEAFYLKLAYGVAQILPIFIVTHVVGLGIEFYYAARKGHAIEEGFLVSGALIPLIMPPDVPLWILAMSVAFAVIIGKEAFGGTGMNIWNVALLSRVFVFFAYPGVISGDEVWVAGLSATEAGSLADYNWWHTGFFNTIFGWFGAGGFDPTSTVVDGFTGATPLSLAFNGGWDGVTSVYSTTQMFWGDIPGSIGETSKPLIIIGALFLLITRIASWRIMFSMLLGAVFMSLVFNAVGANLYMQVPWHYQFYMGSFFFAMAFMATDPVTASGTNTGKWIYGFMIGALGILIRIINPAYPEGWMLAILFMNCFSALIDHYVLKVNINARLKRAMA